MPPVAKAKTTKEIQAEAQRRAWKRASASRNAAQDALDKLRHWGIRVRVTRATIGQPFLHARMAESLLTYRYTDPIILPTETVSDLISKRASKLGTEELFQTMKLEARRWLKKREPTRNRVWKEPQKPGASIPGKKP